MNVVQLFEDTFGIEFLDELQTYAQQKEQLPDLCTKNEYPVPGLPVAHELEVEYRNYRQVYRTPWGIAAPLSSDFTYQQRTHFSRVGYWLYHVNTATATDVAPFPSMQIPQEGTALLNLITGYAQVYQGNAAPNGVPPVWQGRIKVQRLHFPQNSEEALKLIRLQLAKAGVAVFPTALYVQPITLEDYPWVDEHTHTPGTEAYISNDEIRVPLTGYAVDLEAHQVIYVSMVGHKTATRSIWGSLNTNNKRVLQVGAYYGHSTHQYTTFQEPLDTFGNGDQVLRIVDRRTFEEDCAGVAYALLPQGISQAAFYQAFAARLNAVVPFPIAPTWGKTLFQHGLEAELVQKITCGGDVAAAYRLRNEEQWADLVTSLLQTEELVIPEQ